MTQEERKAERARVYFLHLMKTRECPVCRRKDSLKDQPTLDQTTLLKCSKCGAKYSHPEALGAET